MDVQQITLAIIAPVIMLGFFSFVSIATWSNARRKEREAFYRSETMKKVAESGGAGGTTVLELLREEERAARARRREGYKLAGLVCVATGVGMMGFLSTVQRGDPVYMVGLMPLLVGVALLVYVYVIGARD